MSYQLENISILIVDDCQQMAKLTRSVLGSFGLKSIYEAYDTKTGYEIFTKYKPDLAIIDWVMAPEDGLALAQRMRHDKYSPNKYIPIIIMTGFSQKERVIIARDNGITEFLVKPFNARDLYKRIAQVIENPRQFVRSEDYFGPDRRRVVIKGYSGPLRREEDHTKNKTDEEKEFFEIDFG